MVYVVVDEPNVLAQASSGYATELASSIMEDIFPVSWHYQIRGRGGDRRDGGSHRNRARKRIFTGTDETGIVLN